MIVKDVVKATAKGRILIPASLRRRYRRERGTTLRVPETRHRFNIEPMVRDPAEEGQGMLKTKGRILKALVKEREREAKQ